MERVYLRLLCLQIAWAENKESSWFPWVCGIALVLAGGSLRSILKARDTQQNAADNLKAAVKARKGCCGNSKSVRKDSEFSVGQINPVAVEDQNDVYGAEDNPQISQPHSGPQSTHRQNGRRDLKMW